MAESRCGTRHTVARFGPALLRPIRRMVDDILKQLSPQFNKMYAKVGRPSIPPEQLLRAQLLQLLYSVRSERLLMEEMDYNILFRWFVGLNLDDAVWDATVFTKNRDRLLEAEVAKEFLARVVAQAREKGWSLQLLDLPGWRRCRHQARSTRS